MQVVWLLIILAFMSFGLIVIVGAPYVPTRQKELTKLFEHLKLRRGSRIVDMGSGDGRVLALAKKYGYKAVGYELNPILFLISRLRLGKAPNLKINLQSYWSADLSKADMIFVFSAQPFMNRLLKKLEKELKPGAIVVSYAFSFPSHKIDNKFEAFNIYKF